MCRAKQLLPYSYRVITVSAGFVLGGVQSLAEDELCSQKGTQDNHFLYFILTCSKFKLWDIKLNNYFSPTTLVIELLHICDEITTKSWVDDHIQNSHSNVKPPSSRNTEFLARIFCVGFDVYRLDCHTVRTLELAHFEEN